MVPITVIGSCRVYDPMVQTGLTLAQSEVYAYTHNTKENLQLLTLGYLGRPETKALSEMTCVPMAKANFRGFAEIPVQDRFFVMEISSIRIIQYQQWQLQINRFFAYCSEFLPEKVDALSFASEEALKEGLRHCVGLPIDVEEIRYYEQEEDEIMEDLRRIHSMLEGRVLFVPHFNTGKKGGTIWQRERVVNCVNRLAAERDAHVFDPTPHVINYGIKQAIIDLGHYQPAFQQEISRLLHAKLLEILPA